MFNYKPISKLIKTNIKLCAHKEKDLEDPIVHRQLVGSLIYLTMTWLNIIFAVGVISRYIQKPETSHLEGVWQNVRYVKITLDGLLYKKEGECEWSAIVILFMQANMILESQQLDMHFVSAQQSSHGAAKDNQHYRCLLQRLSTNKQLWQLKESTWLVQLMEDLFTKPYWNTILKKKTLHLLNICY